VPRGRYVAIQDEKPQDLQQAQRPEYKVCKFECATMPETDPVHILCWCPIDASRFVK
jgi:hypothetical protein